MGQKVSFCSNFIFIAFSVTDAKYFGTRQRPEPSRLFDREVTKCYISDKYNKEKFAVLLTEMPVWEQLYMLHIPDENFVLLDSTLRILTSKLKL